MYILYTYAVGKCYTDIQILVAFTLDVQMPFDSYILPSFRQACAC